VHFDILHHSMNTLYYRLSQDDEDVVTLLTAVDVTFCAAVYVGVKCIAAIMLASNMAAKINPPNLRVFCMRCFKYRILFNKMHGKLTNGMISILRNEPTVTKCSLPVHRRCIVSVIEMSYPVTSLVYLIRNLPSDIVLPSPDFLASNNTCRQNLGAL